MLSIIRDYLHGQPTERALDDRILMLAKAHEVEGILYKQTKDQRLLPRYMVALYAYENRVRMVGEISALLKKNEIPFFFVKGLEVAKYYPDPFLKTMGDCDLTVHPEDRPKVAALLLENEYTEKKGNQNGQAEWHFKRDGLDIELHFGLLYGNAPGGINDAYLNYVSQCWDYVHDDRLDDSYHLIYLLLHLRKHFMNRGAGVRQFLDIACFSRVEIDWSLVERQLNSIGLLPFARTVYAMIDRWWGLKFPLTGEVSEAFCERETKAILESGVFGFENDSGEKTVLNTANAGKSLWLQKLTFPFPSYRQMCQWGSQYPGLVGRPYLLPFYWVLRAYRHRKDFRKKLRRFRVTEKDLQARNRQLSDWGLR